MPYPSTPTSPTKRPPTFARPESKEITGFGLIEARLRALNSHPHWLVDGSQIVGLPDRSLALLETRSRLLQTSTGFATRDAALDWILARLRRDGGDWSVVLAGMLLPGLQATLGRACRAHPQLRPDLEHEALAGLYVAADRSQPGAGRVAAKLTWAARRAADRYLAAEIRTSETLAKLIVDPTYVTAVEMPAPVEDPEALLRLAVGARVLLAEDAALIRTTRLGGVTLSTAAADLGISAATAGRRRSRAELRLVAWLRRRMDTQPQESPDGFVATGGLFGGCAGGGRPRQGRRPDAQSGVRQPTTPPRR